MKKVLLKTSAEPGHLKFAIVDEGPGIPLDEQPRLFDKFQRLSNRPTNSESSTGLGLSIVKELTGLLGGEITFRTEIGQGSTFVVTLPNEQPLGRTASASTSGQLLIEELSVDRTV